MKKLTFEEIKNFIENRTEYSLEQDYYINDSENLKIKCNHCGKIYYRSFCNIRRDVREGFLKCGDCRTYDRVYHNIRKYFNEHGDGCLLVEKNYKNLTEDKLEIICPSCGKHFNCTFIAFKIKKTKICKSCADKLNKGNRYTYADVKKIINNTNGNTLLSKEYINGKHPLKIQCACGNIYEIPFKYFSKGTNVCERCSNNGVQWTYDLVKLYVEGYGNKLISKEYKNAYTKMIFQCPCGEKYKTTFQIFKGKLDKRCAECGQKEGKRKQALPYEKVKKYVESYGCELISDTYKNAKTLIKIKCGLCGEIFETTYDGFKRKKVKACPTCNKAVSAGERIFKKLLKDNKIKFKTQHSYQECRYKNVLKFDFLLTDTNILVEIDGEQHRRPVGCFGGIKAFKLNQIKDEIKNKYCKEYNIPLIRIPYYDQGEKIEIFIERCELIVEELKIKLKSQSTT